MNRRACLKYLASSALALGVGGTSYGFFEASWLQVDRPKFRLPNLPPSFDGLNIVFLTDIHFGPYNDLDSVRAIVRTTNLLDPDLILLGGDYSVRDKKYIRPCFDVLAELRAPMGVFGVLGTHDYLHGVEETRAGMKRAKITELTNTGVWLTRGAERLRLAGVDDLELGKPDVSAALSDVSTNDACVLLSHNPNVAEELRDPRVGLMLSGYTHGGQVTMPLFGSPWVSGGQKYRAGFVRAPETDVYISRGLGVSGLPVRFGCRPELTLLKLTA